MIKQTTIYYNGKIRTLDDENSIYNSMTVKGNKIIKLDNIDKISELAEEDVESFDLQGKTVIPGLHDSHCHLTRIGTDLITVNLNGVKDQKDLKIRIQKYIKDNQIGKDDWIIGKGWDENCFEGNRIIDKEILDRVCNDIPIFLLRKCGHIASVNSKCLRIVNIDNNTRNPEGGKILKNELGDPSGVLMETAINLVDKKLPKQTKEKVKNLIYLACKEAKKNGLTAVQTEDFKYIGDYSLVIEAFKELKEEKKLPIRVHLKMYFDNPRKFGEFLSKDYEVLKESCDGLLSCGTLKIQLDGILGTNTAYLKEKYLEEDTNGMLFHTKQELYDIMKIGYQNDIHTACHCIGDRALENYLETIEKLNKQYPEKKLRQRAIHCSITDKKVINDMSRLNISADVQLVSLASDYKIIEKKVKKTKAQTSYAWKSMYDKNILVSGSSDCPSETINPFKGMYVGITRQDFEGHIPGGYNPDEKLTLDEVLKMYTRNSAYVCYKENQIGTLEKDKFADFIILDKDPYEIDENEIYKINIKYSCVNGILEKI